MKRRRVLAGIATVTATLAGCVTGPDGSDDDPDDVRDDQGDGRDDDRNDDSTGESGEEPDDEAVVDHFTGEPTRPNCEKGSETVEVEHDDGTREYETAATVLYPDAPTSFAEDDVVEFVEEFERAYVRGDVLCGRSGSGHVLAITYDVETSETFDWHADVTTVFLLRAGDATWGLSDDGAEWVADIAYGGVVYAVDGTGVARAEFDGAGTLDRDEFEADAPDPLEDGKLVASF